LSRSSALASKATGYPIAYIAAKLSIGYTLPELTNKITGVTTACFEPSLDYIVVKAPRWDFRKFRNASKGIGTQMKSVGEVMAIGRCFEEALQKAIRMLDLGRELTEVKDLGRSPQRIRKELTEPTDQRIFYTVKALKSGFSIEEVSKLSGIDPWFLDKIRNILLMEGRITNERLRADTIRSAKILGFSDERIGRLIGKPSENIRRFRKSQGIVPFTKQIDTLAAEWPTNTNYLYLTYGGSEDDLVYPEKDRIVVLGSGCYRIGSSVEFDWCCVNMALALKRPTREVIMVNCNPETVSTDFDVLDKLYFEELTIERVLDIIDKERPTGVVVSVGGQTANNLTLELAKHTRILGTSPTSIDTAEDRSKFSQLLDKLQVQQPEWSRVQNLLEAKKFAQRTGYPVLIRPSYVLSGAAMNVAFDEKQLTEYIEQAAKISKDYPVVISKFLSGAREAEVDGVCDGKNVFIGAIIEHVENAGVHSGDATMSIPTLTIGEATRQRILRYSEMIAQSLRIKGPFNIQFLVKNGDVQVIECNLRASRSMPFVSKMIETNLMDLAAVAIMGGTISPGEGTSTGFGVKAPQFSFTRLDNADPITGVEMVSTGEVACFADTFQDAFIKALIASNFYVPRKGDAVLISMGESRKGIIPYARMLAENGYRIYATRHTAEELAGKGIGSTTLYKVRERKQPNILDYLTSREIKLVINIPSHEKEAESRLILRDEYVIRRKAAEFGIPVVTNLELARALVRALVSFNEKMASPAPFEARNGSSGGSSLSSPNMVQDNENRNPLKTIPATSAF
jgi:carbamoyl-phosphate synthase large subunit